jgi:hypothetical protein
MPAGPCQSRSPCVRPHALRTIAESASPEPCALAPDGSQPGARSLSRPVSRPAFSRKHRRVRLPRPCAIAPDGPRPGTRSRRRAGPRFAKVATARYGRPRITNATWREISAPLNFGCTDSVALISLRSCVRFLVGTPPLLRPFGAWVPLRGSCQTPGCRTGDPSVCRRRRHGPGFSHLRFGREPLPNNCHTRRHALRT